jgi:hypothetical protein
MRPAVDGGCDWGANEDVTSSYAALGDLVSVSTDFSSEINCFGDVADFIFNGSFQLYAGRVVADGLRDDCDQGPCAGSLSFGVYGCTTFFLCAGDYTAEGRFSITLDSNYFWPEPAPAGCLIFTGGLTLQCIVETGIVNVPAFR